MSNLERESQKIQELLQQPDFTRPGSEVNPVNLVMTKINQNFSTANGFPPVEFLYGNPIATVDQNFDSLLFPQDSVMRTNLHTYYLPDGRLLRTQTSYLLAEVLKGKQSESDRLMFCPGLVYRREGNHHQLDIWYLRKSPVQFTEEQVIALLNLTIDGLVPECDRIVKPKSLYYISNGYKLKVSFQGRPQTFLNGGVLAPQILINAGLNPNEYTGIAIGLGLDRLAMYVKGINDHRVLTSHDPRIKSQMTNLDPYREVSKFPCVIRDLSICVETSISLEDIDFVLGALLDDDTRATIERIDLISETQYKDIPVQARDRLNIRTDQKNLLVRFTLRSLERTLTRQESNGLRDDLFALVNNLNKKRTEDLRKLSLES